MSHLQRAHDLFEQTKYEEASYACLDAIKADEDKKEAYIFFIKSFLYMLTPFNAEDSRETIADCAVNAVAQCETIEEVFDVEYRIEEILYEWERIAFTASMELLLEEPTLDNWGKIIPSTPIYTLLRTLTSVVIRDTPIYDQAAEKAGLETDDYAKQYGKEYVCDFSQYTCTYETGVKLYNITLAQVEKFANSNVDTCQALGEMVIQQIHLAHLLIDYGIEDSEDADKDVMLERLQMDRHILENASSITVYPNGKAVKIFDPWHFNDERRELYRKMKELDESFVAPELPQKPEVTQTTSSGGCYVATAVYGSYDCPQVWTLRRFRDSTLGATWYGRLFIALYYAVSPTLVRWFGETAWFKKMWKGKLDRLVARLQQQGVDSTPYEDISWK